MTTIITKTDLRFIDTPILNQGTLNTCSENALQSALDIMMKLAGHEIAPISRMQSYVDARLGAGMFGPQYGDAGTVATAMLDAAKTKGLAAESSFDYGYHHLYTMPDTSTYAEAALHTLQGYTSIGDGLAYNALRNAINGALEKGKPVLLSFNARSYLAAETGPLDSQWGYGDGPVLGGHMLVIVGSDRDTGNYIVQNSSGAGWGDNGYGRISYVQFMAHPEDFKAAYTLDGFDGLDFTWTDARVNVAQHYATVLGRAAEVGGLDYWAAANLSDVDLTAAMLYSPEGTLKYGHMTNAEFVASMYHSVLGRAADAGGAAFYTAALDAGASRAAIMSGVINDVERPVAEKAAHDYLVNLTNLASYISITMQYDGERNADTAAALQQVTANADKLEIIKIGLPELLHG